MKKSVYFVLCAAMVWGMMMGMSGCAGSKQNVETNQPAADGNPQQAVDMSGRWTMMVETPQGSGSPTFDLTQQGDQLSGEYNGKFGTFPVTGTVTGNNFVIQYDSSGTLIKYIGEVDGNTAKGKVDFASYGEGMFTGEKE